MTEGENAEVLSQQDICFLGGIITDFIWLVSLFIEPLLNLAFLRYCLISQLNFPLLGLEWGIETTCKGFGEEIPLKPRQISETHFQKVQNFTGLYSDCFA